MVINQEITTILKENNVDVDKAILYLLCIYHGINTNNTLLTELEIREINSLKIADRDYDTGSITWNVPMYAGEKIEFEWVKDWMQPFGNINPERKGVYSTCVQRMKKFFSTYPQYRKQDVYAARDLYLRSVTNSQFVMKSHKFIFDGAGAMQNSELLGYCERLAESEVNESQIKGVIM